MAAHALLSPSSAHRWLNCTASPRLEEREPDQSSSYAEEGSLAHAYCARVLKRYMELPVDTENAEIAQLEGRYHTGEMDEHVSTYCAAVIGKLEKARETTPDARILIERRLDFTNYVPDAFGTADAIIIADGTMDVIDFKYGKGVRVDAERNPQMMIYALGAYDEFSLEYNIKNVRMTIIQPRIDNISEWQIPVYELISWAENTLKPKAKEAYDGKGEQNPGEWCRFCKIKGKCRALAADCIRTAEEFADPRVLSAEVMAKDVLPRLAVIKSWVSDIEEYALQQAIAGVKYEGFKVVEGRSNRKIVNPDKVAEALSDYQPEQIWKPRELRTITDLEKLTGKRKFAELCSPYIEKPQGKPALVPESDKRPPFNSAENDFKGIEL